LSTGIGISVSILSLVLGIFTFIQPDEEHIERNCLVFQVAQNFRYNHDWLSEISVAVAERAQVLPTGSLKFDALMSLANRYYQRITENAYGEQKHIYQEILKLRDLGVALGKPRNYSQVELFNRQSMYSLHDILFLNDFLNWYLRPLIEKELNDKQLYSLNWWHVPVDCSNIDGVKTVHMKHFVDEGKPIENFIDYLGIID